MKTITGVIAATITPVHRDGTLDVELYEKHLRYLLDAGVHGLFIGGTAGEGVYITAEIRFQIFQTAREIAGKRIPLYAAFLRPDTRTIIREMNEFSRRCGDEGPDFVSAVAPLYYPVGQEALERHFVAIADAAPAPLIVYNIPGNTHNPLELDTVVRLAQHPNIAGIKESSSDFALYSQGLLATGNDYFAWIQGKDLHDGPSLMLGGPALITGLGNVWIEPYVELYDAVVSGHKAIAADAQNRINRLSAAVRSVGGGPIPAIKAASTARWRTPGFTCLPAMDLSDELQKLLHEKIEQVMR